MENLVEVLRERARTLGDAEAVVFLEADVRLGLSYAELDTKARSIAVSLQQAGAKPGDHVLLVLPPGLDFIAGFYGCLYAGVVAVPVPPPARIGRDKASARVLAVAKHSRAGYALTTSGLLGSFPASGQASLLGSECRVLALDTAQHLTASEWRDPGSHGESIAFLQYTSGSTGAPKGVMVTHGNLLANSARIRDAFGHTRADRGVIWLPPYHDMGLIGGILQPIFVGFPVVLMTPKAFILRPARWLETISRERATISGGPNFAYELALTMPDDRIAELELSSWRLAFTGAEPVRAATIERFARKFERTGFRRSAFLPVYGLAEATLLVSAGEPGREPVLRDYDVEALEGGRAVVAEGGKSRRLVGCGIPRERLEIVSPDSRTPCPDGVVGEIWLKGPSVASGYFAEPEATAAVFHAELVAANSGEHHLRTGDLGFLRDGELFVCGRIKDLIIVRGRNLAPQDIEADAMASHPAVVAGGVAAFSVEHDGGEGLVIVAEVSLNLSDDEPATIAACIARRVAKEHEVPVERVVLVKPRAIPRTPTGKLQRSAARAELAHGGLPTLALLRPEAAPSAGLTDATEQALTRVWTAMFGRAVRADDNFFDLGGDSVRSVQLQALAAESGVHFELHELLEQPTIALLSAVARLAPPSDDATIVTVSARAPSRAQAEIVLRELSARRGS